MIKRIFLTLKKRLDPNKLNKVKHIHYFSNGITDIRGGLNETNKGPGRRIIVYSNFCMYPIDNILYSIYGYYYVLVFAAAADLLYSEKQPEARHYGINYIFAYIPYACRGFADSFCFIFLVVWVGYGIFIAFQKIRIGDIGGRKLNEYHFSRFTLRVCHSGSSYRRHGNNERYN